MSQPPHAEAPTGSQGPAGDFGATTVSGSPTAVPATKPGRGKPPARPAANAPTTPVQAPANAGRQPNVPRGGSARPPLVTGTAAGWTPPPQGTAVPTLPGGPANPRVVGAGGPTGLGQPGQPGAPLGQGGSGQPGHAAGAAATKGTRSAPPRGPRRAKLQLRHINPLTVLRFSCVLAIALFFVWLIVVGLLYVVLDASGVISKVNDTVTTINGPGSRAPVTGGIVFGGAAIVGVINVVLFIALTTVGSLVYNLCADLVGGVELTLSER